MSDQSKITLNANSTLKYPVAFNKAERRVKLTGVAFFEVAHNANHPFIVETEQEEITVLGTSFYVDANKESNETSVYVKTGKVAFRSKSRNEAIILTANETAYHRPNEQFFAKDKNLPQNHYSWHNKQLEFTGAAMSDVVQSLSDFYKIELTLLDTKLANCPVTMNFKKETQEASFEALTTVFGFELVQVNEQQYQLKGGKCE